MLHKDNAEAAAEYIDARLTAAAKGGIKARGKSGRRSAVQIKAEEKRAQARLRAKRFREKQKKKAQSSE